MKHVLVWWTINAKEGRPWLTLIFKKVWPKTSGLTLIFKKVWPNNSGPTPISKQVWPKRFGLTIIFKQVRTQRSGLILIFKTVRPKRYEIVKRNSQPNFKSYVFIKQLFASQSHISNFQNYKFEVFKV